jgi:hypothetical protein
MGTDCASAVSATKCVVDRWVLPLVGIVFGDDDDIADSQLLQKLREHCPYAFMGEIGSLRDAALFSKMRETLLDSYDSTNKNKLELVSQMANGLLFAVFGVGVAGERDAKRGLQHTSSDETPHKIYVQQANCARYIAEKLGENEQKISDGGITFSYVLSDDRYVTPGSSLYLFSQRVSVFVPIRWLMQCVVWAKNSLDGEGGVHDRWVKEVIAGNVAQVKDGESCDNWIRGHSDVPAIRITLKQRLLTAQTIFVESGTTDNQVWSQNEIASDVTDAVIMVLDQLGARSLPDLWCWTRDTLTSPELPLDTETVSEVIRRETSTRTALFALDVDVETYGKKDDRPELSIHGLVRDWLLNGIPVRNEVGTEVQWTLMTRKQLLAANVVRTRDPYLLDPVSVNETHWSMYEFKRLDDIASQVFTAEGVDNFGNYLDRTSNSKCWKKDGSYQLQRPEFEVKGDAFKHCGGLGSLLTCETLEQQVSHYTHRKALPKPFLRRHELLYLVLVLVERAMHDSLTGGLSSLHIPREGWIEIN